MCEWNKPLPLPATTDENANVNNENNNNNNYAFHTLSHRTPKTIHKHFCSLCSYDTRTTITPSHWSDTSIMGNRTIFRANQEPAELIIKQVKVIISFIIIMVINVYVCYTVSQLWLSHIFAQRPFYFPSPA